MSVPDIFEQVFHLTLDGWVRGESSGSPAGVIETWKERLSQASMHAPTYSTKTLLWADPAYTEDDRKTIRLRFQEPFDGESPSPWAGYVRPSKASTAPSKPLTPPHPEFDFGDDSN